MFNLVGRNSVNPILTEIPTKNEAGRIHRKETLFPKISAEKLIRALATTLADIPRNVPKIDALGMNNAIKKGTNNGPTNKLTVLKLISSRLPLILSTIRLIRTARMPMTSEIYLAYLS